MRQAFHGRVARLWIAGLATILLSACGQSEAPDCGGLHVNQPWVRAAPAGADVMAAYFTLDNQGDAAVTVNGASSSQFERAEMHETVVNDDGQASMQPLDKVTIPAGDQVQFKAGGRHVMLFSPSQDYTAGDQVEVILACGSGQAELPVAAVVRSQAPSTNGEPPDANDKVTGSAQSDGSDSAE